MTETRVWAGDTHDISWSVTSAGAAVSLASATVRLLAKPLDGSALVVLDNAVATNVVTHTLTGTLAVGSYDVVVEATQAGDVVTYPDATDGPVRLVVVRDIG